MRKKLYSSIGIVFVCFFICNQLSAQTCIPSTPAVFTNNTPVAIPTGPGVVTSTINVAGAPTYLYKLTVTTFITHTFCADLDITIQSPSGTVVTLTSDNGGANDNVFNGTVWDDAANPAGQVPYTTNNGLVTDHVYTNLVLASPLVPEEALGAFIGENPNGTWTITISDDLAGDGGSLNSWSLSISGLSAPPITTAFAFSNNTPVVIPTGPGVVTSTINVIGAGTQLLDVNVTTFISHTFNADLDITIQSPSGTVVTLTSDNGAGNDNVFNGTVWDDDANPAGQVPYTSNNGLVTDHVYTNLVLASPLVPEEALGAFIGENPNGTWTITISDDLAGDGGTLNSWSLNIVTALCATSVCTITCPSNIITNNTPNQCGAVVNFTIPPTSGICGTVTATPASGSFFPVGTTTVTVRSNVLYGQTGAPDNGAPSQNFEAAINTFDCQAAEDFTVPAGQNWSVNKVIVGGTYTGTGVPPPSSINVTFYNNAGGLPGTVFATFANVTTFTGAPNFDITLPSSLAMPGGGAGTTYWVSVQPNMDFTPSGQWFWSNYGATNVGSEYAWQNPGGGFGTTCTSWGPGSTGCGVGGGINRNLIFTIAGTGANNAVCTFNVTVNDVQPPTITCPANIVVSNTPGQCGAIVNFPAGTASDNCPGFTVTSSPASGSFFPLGTTTVTQTVTDASGNTATCTFTVTVNDTQPPTITCPANIVTGTNPGICGAVVNWNMPAVTDNCPLPGEVTLSQSVTRNIVPIQIGCQIGGLTTPNSWWRAYNLAPLALPGPLTITRITFGIERVTAASGSIPLTLRLYTSAGAFPGAPRTQIASQAFTATNAMTNSIQSVNLTTPVTVPANAIVAVELFAPDGRAPVNHTFFIGSNAGGQTGPSYIQAPDCGAPDPTNLASLGFPNDHIILDFSGTVPVVPPVVQQTAGLPSGSTYPVGTTTNTFLATDAAGNTSTCSFTVTVNDTEQPTITCPANQVRNTDPGQCYATYTPPQPTFADNCGVTRLTWAMTGATTGTSPATGINYVPSTQFGLTGTTGVGVTTITYTAADAAGNTRTCSFTVTVNDASIPVISTQPATKFVCAGSDAVFSIVASAGAGNPLTYQWQQWNGSAWVNITGATSATLTIPAVTFAQNTNTYRCVLTGRCSVVNSAAATLYVNPVPVVTLTTSIPPALIPGQSLNITSTVSMGGGTYAWYKNGVLLTSPLQQLPVLSGLTVNDIGTYRLVYTDPNGCVGTSADVVVSGQASDKLWVYPVPNNGRFQVRFYNELNESATIRVFDAKGAKVYERAMVTNIAYTQIDVDLGPTMADGTYIVELVNAAGRRVGAKKIIVRKLP